MKNFSVFSCRNIRRRAAALGLALFLCNAENALFSFSPVRIPDNEPYPKDVDFKKNHDSPCDQAEKATYPRGLDNESFFYFSTNNVFWQINLSNGTIAALDPETQKPLWSEDGIVFRMIPSFKTLDLEPPFSSPEPNLSASRATEINERVYFLLDSEPWKRSNFSEPARPFQTNLLVALDPRAEGRLVWVVRAADFEPYFSNVSEEASCEFIATPTGDESDRLLLYIKRGGERRQFFIDAASGIFLTVNKVDAATLSPFSLSFFASSTLKESL